MKYSPELVSEERKENIYKHAKRKDRHSCSKKMYQLALTFVTKLLWVFILLNRNLRLLSSLTDRFLTNEAGKDGSLDVSDESLSSWREGLSHNRVRCTITRLPSMPLV